MFKTLFLLMEVSIYLSKSLQVLFSKYEIDLINTSCSNKYRRILSTYVWHPIIIDFKNAFLITF